MQDRSKAHLVILALGLMGSLLAFSPSLTAPFRSDEWYIANFSQHTSLTLEAIGQVSYWELFGDPRFQPFSHLLLFLIHKVLGNNFLLFHLLNWVSHVIVGLLIYAIVREVHGDKMTSSLCAVLFLTGYSHFDTVSWTYHIYIIHQTACLLFGFWVVLKDPSQLRWWQALVGGILVGFACYFYEAALVIPILILMVMLWLHHASLKRDLGSNLRKLSVFAVCMVVVYGGFLGLYLSSVGGQLTGRIDWALFLKAAQNTLSGLWQQGVIANLGFPPQQAIGDLFYLQGSAFGILPVLGIALLLAAVAVGLRAHGLRHLEQIKHLGALVVIFLVCTVSYYGIIAIGRFNLYVVTQARYFYLPDAFLVLVLSWPLAMVGSAWREQYSHSGGDAGHHSFRAIMHPKTWAWCAVCIIIILNTCHIYAACREIARILSPVKESIETVKHFSKTRDSGSRLYVDFVPRNLDDKLFGGTHVALETCFAGTGMLTRNIAEAAFVYDRADGISPSPRLESQEADSTDFTLEFDYVMWGRLITVIDSPENTFRIRQVSADENELLLRLTYRLGKNQRELYMSARHPRHYVSHVVIQKQNDTLYMVEEGRLIAVRRIGQGEIRWQDDMLFLGSRVVFPPQYCYLENFFACVGKAKYALEGVAVGDLAPDKGLRAPMPALNSDPLYWSTVRKRSFWG
jgi:hypothetical protein